MEGDLGILAALSSFGWSSYVEQSGGSFGAAATDLGFSVSVPVMGGSVYINLLLVDRLRTQKYLKFV